jgi:uncharacterized protein
VAIDQYITDLQEWRARLDAELRAPEGWLSVIALDWFQPGLNRVGSADDAAVRLPADAVGGHVADFVLDGDQVRLLAHSADVLVNGGEVPDRPLSADMDAQPDRLMFGRLSALVLRRGARVGVRVRDPQAPTRLQFGGRRWYAARPEMRISAEWVAHREPRQVPITNILGDVNPVDSPGYAAFLLDGVPVELDATPAGSGLMFHFRDATNAATTYGAGRWVITAAAQDGRVEIDFNRAVNPPCCFTVHATCPLPPQRNRLTLPIAAGELRPAEDSHAEH